MKQNEKFILSSFFKKINRFLHFFLPIRVVSMTYL